MTKEERQQQVEELLARLRPDDAATFRVYLGDWEAPDFEKRARRLVDLIEYAMTG